MSARVIRALLTLTLTLPATALAKPGDVYLKAGGPSPSVPAVVRPPSFRGSCKEVASRAECEQGIRAARIAAQGEAASRGLEAGYLQGFTFGLHDGLKKSAKDPGAIEKANKDALASDKLVGAVESAKKTARELGAKQGSAAVTAMFDEAFDQRRTPRTELNIARVAIPAYELVADPALEFYGPKLKTEDILLREAISPSLTIPGNVSRAYFTGKTYPVLESYRAGGKHSVEYDDVLEPDAGWKLHLAANTGEDGTAPSPSDVFEVAFRNAYREYAQHEFSSMFYRSLDVGATDGLALGQKAAERLLYVATARDTIASAYRSSVPDAFRDGFRAAYQAAWDKEVKHRETTPILSVKNIQLVDAVRDGVLSPGEALRVSFDVENRGLARTTLPVRLEGAVAEAAPQDVTVAAFGSQALKSGVVARVDPKTPPRSKVSIQAHVGDSEQKTEVEVRQVLELARVELGELVAGEGRGSLKVTVANPTTHRSKSAKISVQRNDDVVARASVPRVNSQKERELTIAFKDVDPLALMEGIPTRVELRIADQLVHTRRYDINTDQSDAALLNYFDQLAYGDGYVPKGISRKDQIEHASSALIRLGRSEIKKLRGKWANAWKLDSPNTLVGRVVTQYETASHEAKPHYVDLVESVCGLSTEIGGLRFRKRAAYNDVCVRAQPRVDKSGAKSDP